MNATPLTGTCSTPISSNPLSSARSSRISNYTQFIEPCLGSIAAQSYRHFECVVVDDASTDTSVSIIENFITRDLAHGQFRLVRHTENQGQMAAFQTGLQHTTGGFVVFVDADDVLLSDFLETHLKAHLNSCYEAAFSSSDQFQIDSDGRLLSGTQSIMYRPRGDRRSIARTLQDGQHEWVFSATQPTSFHQPHGRLHYYQPWTSMRGAGFGARRAARCFGATGSTWSCRRNRLVFRICADRYLFNFAHALGGRCSFPASMAAIAATLIKPASPTIRLSAAATAPVTGGEIPTHWPGT